MADWRLDGMSRTARRDTTYQTCPRPTPEERLRLILVDLKTSPLHVVQGRRFGMGQRTAHPWMHGLWVVLRATRRRLGDAPSRSVQALAQRVGVAEADVRAMVVPTPARPTPADAPAATPAPAPASPRVVTMALHGASHAPRIRLSRRAVIAARTGATRSNTCG